MTTIQLSPPLASSLARTTLDHVTREYPNKLDHVLGSAADARTPQSLHPLFFGSFDWHSCVHSWWTLFTLRRLQPALPEAAQIAALADQIFTPAAVAGELDYLARPESAGFERPYGWAWLLMLAAELRRTPEGDRWGVVLHPLTCAFVDRFKAFLPKSPYPVRAGVHTNTAFALRLAIEYARVAGDAELLHLAEQKAIAWYGRDRDCPAWEPSQDEFLSPTLIEAELMRYALAPDAFRVWFDGFLGASADRVPASLLEPPTVTDRTDGKIAHLDGLSLSRAWCWSSLADAFPSADRRRPLARTAAERHLAAALPHIAEDYMGQHWLASFVVLALTADREIQA